MSNEGWAQSSFITVVLYNLIIVLWETWLPNEKQVCPCEWWDMLTIDEVTSPLIAHGNRVLQIHGELLGRLYCFIIVYPHCLVVTSSFYFNNLPDFLFTPCFFKWPSIMKRTEDPNADHSSSGKKGFYWGQRGTTKSTHKEGDN